MCAFGRILKAHTPGSKVTKVTAKVAQFACVVLVLLVGADAQSQQEPPPAATSGSHGTAESLYLRLHSVGLDVNRVYRIRDGYLDRKAIHISMDDGTIAFTESVDGHVTGAFFEGDGEVLLSPPNSTERTSLALFTGGAILEENFSTAYLRFNDDVYAELKPYLREAENPQDFVSRWNDTAKALAAQDALRLMLTFAGTQESDPATLQSRTDDHLLRGLLNGDKLGPFDVWYDTLVPEQIAAGQRKSNGGAESYDV